MCQTSDYPRKVVTEALVNNHPSRATQPSRADELLTQALKTALALVDIKLLDHLIVAGGDILSFAERGLL